MPGTHKQKQQSIFEQFENFATNIDKPNDFKTTGINKSLYLDVAELCFDAYSIDELDEIAKSSVGKKLDDVQAYSRVTSALGILIANGRKTEHRQLWERMMDACIDTVILPDNDIKFDFSVKEIMLSYKAMKPFVAKEKLALWAEKLKSINPYTCYAYNIKNLSDPQLLHNISIYNMAGEFLRETEGFTDTTEYFKEHWVFQQKRFNKLGMYCDPGCPMLYDLSARAQIQLILGNGYDGEFAEFLDEQLKKAGIMTIYMQSSANLFPYGGRSNQYQFNEALVAAICEFEASRYKKLGDMKKAGIFKRTAHLSSKAILRWIKEATPPRHIKNFYPISSKFGTESYGYYNKYMVTLGNFIYIAFLFADDSIEEYPCPSEIGGYAFMLSDDFHKIFANCCGYSIEEDYSADLHYDSTGLGRIHKTGFPPELAISTPFSKQPEYVLPQEVAKADVSVSVGWDDGHGHIKHLSSLSDGLKSEVKFIKSTADCVEFEVKYSGDALDGISGVNEHYKIDSDGIHITAHLIRPKINKIFYSIPLLYTNGRDKTIMTIEDNGVNLCMNGFNYCIESDGVDSLNNEMIANRNGEYRLYMIEKASDTLCINLKLYM